jgi:hypothetical protein
MQQVIVVDALVPQILMSAVNVFALAAHAAKQPEELRSRVMAEARLEAETSCFLKKIKDLHDWGVAWSVLENCAGYFKSPLGDIWQQWLTVAKVRFDPAGLPPNAGVVSKSPRALNDLACTSGTPGFFSGELPNGVHGAFPQSVTQGDDAAALQAALETLVANPMLPVGTPMIFIQSAMTCGEVKQLALRRGPEIDWTSLATHLGHPVLAAFLRDICQQTIWRRSLGRACGGHVKFAATTQRQQGFVLNNIGVDLVTATINLVVGQNQNNVNRHDTA